MSTMHDSRGSSTRGSENSSSPVRSSFEGGNGNGLASVYSSYSGSPSIHYPDRSIPDYVKLPGQSDDSFTDYSTGTDRNASTFGSLGSAARLSETHMASRRAEEAANRRCQAASWLQEMIGPLSLPRQPSEEELRLCLRNGLVLCNVINKVHPGAVPKVVENPISSHDGAQFAYQHFENVRNFLVAVEDMGLPAFEASDLEQGSLSPSSSAKVVACILALRSYHEWKQGGALGFWRLKSPNLPTVYGTSPSKTSTRGIKAPRKWFPTEQDYADNMELFSPSAQSTNSMSFDKDSRASFEGMLESNAPSQSLLSLVTTILGGKPMEEVPMLVEFMLRKVMEEFEHHLLAQRRQVVKMKSALKDLLMQAEERASQNMVLEALTAGSQEEVKMITKKLQLVKMEKKQIEDENQLKEVALKRLSKESEEKEATVQVLMNELDYIKRLDEEHSVTLENQKREIELKSQEKLLSLEKQLQESQQQRHEMEVSFTEELSMLQKKDVKYKTCLAHQAYNVKDLRWTQVDVRKEVLQMQKDFRSQFSALENQLPEMARAAAGYHKVLAENRQLYNEVQDLKGNIRVYCRVRPFLTEEPGRPTTVDYIGENGELVVVNPSKLGAKDARKSFTFNKVFGTTASQEEVFLDTQPLIRSVLDGYNVCIFAYGQTGSGKTFTMSGPSSDWGVNYRALHDLFNMTQSRLGVFRYEIDVQMLEIYNEQVRDLLIMDGTQKKYPLETDLSFLELFIRNNSQLNGMNVPDASMLRVRSTEDVVELMRVGQKNRAIGATALNERSSRSHSVLTVHVQGRDLISGALLRGSLHLVDLAGSERVDRSEATGDRLKEAQHINKSLSALGDVIAALAQKNSHVPYRNSKLTQLLQDSLGGQAKTLMFVHISPDMESFGETISTLKFAERVSSVELGAARSNKESGDMQNLKDQIAQLRDAAAKKDAEIERLQSLKDLSPPVESDHSAHSSAGSPLDSPTELRPPSEFSEEGVTSVNESIKYVKEGRNSQLYAKQSSKEQEAVLLAHQDMQDEKIKFLETENEKLKNGLKDCEEALQMANNETEKSNKVARDAKAKIAELESRVHDLEGAVQAAGAKGAELELKLKDAEEKYAGAEKTIQKLQSELSSAKDTHAKFENNLHGVQTNLQDRETKLDQLSKAAADKDATIEKKESKIGDLSEKVDHFKSRALPAEEKASELGGLTGELQSKAAGTEEKLSNVGQEKDQTAGAVDDYKEELKNSVARSNTIAEALSQEKERTTQLEQELAELKKQNDADSAHARVLAERIAELEKIISTTTDDKESVKQNLEGEKKSLAEGKDSEAGKKAEVESKSKNLEGEKRGLLAKIQGAFSKADNKEAEAAAKASEAKEKGQKADELEGTLGSTADKAKEKEEAEKSLGTQLEANKAKAAAGEKAAAELQEKEGKIGELDNDLKSHGDRLADLGTKLQNLRQERDEAVSKAETNEEKVKALESKISELESEVESLTERNSDLEEQLRKVGGKVEEHKSAIRGREETAVKKAQKAKELQEEVQETEENIQDTDKEFVKSAQTDVSAANQ
ncbi:unnamed protein product [Sphagnum compactum]